METENAAQRGNEFTEPGLIRGATGSKRLSGEAVAGGSAAIAEPVSGTKDIVFLLKDGQVRQFDDDEHSREMANHYFDSFADLIFSIHFGESCYYVKDGKLSARLHMTRDEFFNGVQP